MMEILAILYALTAVALAIYGFNALLFTVLFLLSSKPRRGAADGARRVAPLPTVVVQLPLYNERFVVERLIESVAALDYPADKLFIQVLDDSNDDTVALARARVAHYRAKGVNIDYMQRPVRTGYKAGALAYGLAHTTADFVAVFDADFLPPTDFLLKVMPQFGDPNIGMVQARWGHLNADASALTRAQAIMLDGHFGIEQTVRHRSALLLNFNGSAGVWRRVCIEEAGGWQADTIAEDLDLSYRAQLRGWRLMYLPDLVVPAEIPSLLTAFKRQQFRWAKGSIQCVLKISASLMLSGQSAWRKFEGMLHLLSYTMHPLMLAMVLLSLPMVVTGHMSRVHLGAIGLAGFGAPVLFAVSQWKLYDDWKTRIRFLPMLMLLGAGIAVNNSWAVIEALIGRNPTLFLRTPKLSNSPTGETGEPYHLPIDWSTWVELLFMAYSFVTLIAALRYAPGLAPFMAIYTAGFGYTALLGLWQSYGAQLTQRWQKTETRLWQG